ncbi:hypothetical protein FGO68_gene6553 [Halteria grandinella]|uniref:Uncharacterized protein n=1 Tax=Halteria grandinella TaxID=5974 RepID=A0A8J8NL52_HALGN|nr:hypothetical protein FGO68_gene6553 [Halteria grandinella]
MVEASQTTQLSDKYLNIDKGPSTETGESKASSETQASTYLEEQKVDEQTIKLTELCEATKKIINDHQELVSLLEKYARPQSTLTSRYQSIKDLLKQQPEPSSQRSYTEQIIKTLKQHNILTKSPVEVLWSCFSGIIGDVAQKEEFKTLKVENLELFQRLVLQYVHISINQLRHKPFPNHKRILQERKNLSELREEILKELNQLENIKNNSESILLAMKVRGILEGMGNDERFRAYSLNIDKLQTISEGAKKESQDIKGENQDLKAEIIMLKLEKDQQFNLLSQEIRELKEAINQLNKRDDLNDSDQVNAENSSFKQIKDSFQLSRGSQL